MIHLACAADEKYGPFCAAMLRSALDRCPPGRLAVHFLHAPELDPSMLQRLRGMIEAGGGSFHPTAIAAEDIRELPATAHFPRIIWYRVLLPRLRPDLERILYVDCDTLIVDSLLPLWRCDLEGHYVGAVQNLIEPALATRHHSLGIPPEQVYFNSGMLLMNLALMREDDCIPKLFEYARRYGTEIVWPDQDALNCVLGPKALLVHPRWNCQNSFFFWPQAREVFGETALAEATSAPAILHFEGPPDTKPWHYLNRHPYRARYREYLRRTPFPVPPLQGRTLKNFLLKHLPAGAFERLRTMVRSARKALRRLAGKGAS